MNLNEALVNLSKGDFHLLMEDVFASLEEEIEYFNLSYKDKIDIIKIAEICIKFGVINKISSSSAIEKEPDLYTRTVLYTARWLKKLVSHRSRPIILKQAPPLNERNIVRDPALTLVLEQYYKQNGINVRPKEIEMAINSHDLLMSIENIQGHLLEEYIAHNICKPPFNFIWLEGEIVKAADFALYLEENNKLYLLQIKNKYNTENSSSVTVRDVSTVEISKWYRLGKKKDKGVNIPFFKWPELNEIIQEFTGQSPHLSEVGYHTFLETVLRQNPKLINI